MIKYFEYERSDNWIDCPYVFKIDDEINKYAEENNLEIVSAACDRDKGIFVIFKKS